MKNPGMENNTNLSVGAQIGRFIKLARTHCKEIYQKFIIANTKHHIYGAIVPIYHKEHPALPSTSTTSGDKYVDLEHHSSDMCCPMLASPTPLYRIPQHLPYPLRVARCALRAVPCPTSLSPSPLASSFPGHPSLRVARCAQRATILCTYVSYERVHCLPPGVSFTTSLSRSSGTSIDFASL